MADGSPDPPTSRQTRIQAELLPAFRAIFSSAGAFAALGDILQVEIVIDASVVIGDLLWLTTKRANPSARTNLQELIASETVIATAPAYLDVEIAKKLPEIAQSEGLTVEVLQTAWTEYRAGLQLQPAEEAEPSGPARDPKDLPYIRLQQKTGRPIYTKDSDFSGMGAVVLEAQVFVRLRDYARHASLEFAVKAGGLLVGGIGIAAVVGIWKGLAGAVSWFRRLSPSMQIVLGLSVIALLVHPRSRAYLAELLKELAPAAAAAAESLLVSAAPYLCGYSESAVRSAELRKELEGAIPAARARDGKRTP